MTAPLSAAQATESGLSFIEVQFPVSKLSKESYKERKAGATQTLTSLGKWWGRKPLVLIRAIILGLLLPATDNPSLDREIFLQLMTMDDDGMFQRLIGALSAKEVSTLCTPLESGRCFEEGAAKITWRRGMSTADRRSIMHRAFLRMGYDQRLAHCRRPEEIDGPTTETWAKINQHLGTTATTLPQFATELGMRRFGAVPRLGDVFAGGGSVPFEAARLGCDTFASDLNPVAALLTWGALNITGGGQEAATKIVLAQQRVFTAVCKQVSAWGIERNEEGWVADAYLYCNEVLDPATGWKVPLAPTWVIAPGRQVIAQLVPKAETRQFEILIVEGASQQDLEAAAIEGTWRDGVRCPVDRGGNVLPPSSRQSTSFDRLRGSSGLRLWEDTDVVPRPDDVFQERLYCIRWLDPNTGKRHYKAPSEADIEREHLVLALLADRFSRWQLEGILPSRRIEPGQKTEEPIRTRGWTYWHHLFNPRQLLISGLFGEHAKQEDTFESTALLLMQGRLADWNSRLCGWNPFKAPGTGFGERTFYNQALNPLVNYSCRPASLLKGVYCIEFSSEKLPGPFTIALADAGSIDWRADIWITDPGYGDVIMYDEL
ncbi:MAG TPA: DUF1156 domain-containing protein, partial [Acidimicrobiales bacterium]|nr:DUF1156 domain-containing protein [Acidimicrobiales bacterium]